MRCIETCWLTPPSIICCLPLIAISLMRRVSGAAHVVVGRCIRPHIRASRGGGCAGSGLSMTDASVSVVRSMGAGRG